MNNNSKKPAKTQNGQYKSGSKETVTYLGPTVKGVAKNGTTYTGGIPKELKELIEKDARFGELCIDTENLADAVRQLSEKESVLKSIYDSIVRG